MKRTMNDTSSKRVISVALTGSWPTKADNPRLPVTPKEIARDVFECWEAGAAVAHIHVRDDDGAPCMDFEKYEEAVHLVRENKDCDININLTTSGISGMDDDTRIYPLERLRPEMASYDCGSLNWMHNVIFENHPRFLEKLGYAMQKYQIKPEIEIFDTGMIYNALHYIEQGVLIPPCHFQLVLGAAGGMTATIDNLLHLYNQLPDNCTWAACGIGKAHMPVLLTTIALGGHLRVGMEDNVMYQKGVLAESNAQFVFRAKRMLEEAGCQAATPEEARHMFNLRPRS
jgi:uncharacterized protein (DUF849 family)